jgi:UDP-N-acetylmuramoylalanine--D-glutamate ligase
VTASTTATTPSATAALTLIVGLGRTGVSCARHLQSLGVPFAVTDSRDEPPGLSDLAKIAPQAIVRTGGFDLTLIERANAIVASPGVSLREPLLVAAAARGLSIIGDIELFARAAKAPIAAITGTNGKSTVTTLLGEMAAAAGKRVLVGGNLGRPALELLDEPVPDLYVLELSSFQLDTVQTLSTAAATVLNVSPDHMDRYDTLADYAASKARIFERCAVAVVNAAEPLVCDMASAVPRVLGFSDAPPPSRTRCNIDYWVEESATDLHLMRRGAEIARMSQLQIAGRHNAANALAALAMAEGLELPPEACLQALRDFTGLAHRCQAVATVAGVRYVDDSKGTNVGATLAAIRGLPGQLVLIAGGLGKGQEFAALTDACRNKVRHAVLIGQDAPLLAAALENTCSLESAGSMEQAVELAASAARPGETVLLSPACASMDMFRDYAHRGRVFAAAVKALPA